jgi:hypothetical protein
VKYKETHKGREESEKQGDREREEGEKDLL